MKDKGDLKLLIDRAKKICKLESDKLYLQYDIDFSFDHYDSEVRTVYVRESVISRNPVTYEILQDLELEIRTQVNKKWIIGIIYEQDVTSYETIKR